MPRERSPLLREKRICANKLFSSKQTIPRAHCNESILLKSHYDISESQEGVGVGGGGRGEGKGQEEANVSHLVCNEK